MSVCQYMYLKDLKYVSKYQIGIRSLIGASLIIIYLSVSQFYPFIGAAASLLCRSVAVRRVVSVFHVISRHPLYWNISFSYMSSWRTRSALELGCTCCTFCSLPPSFAFIKTFIAAPVIAVWDASALFWYPPRSKFKGRLENPLALPHTTWRHRRGSPQLKTLPCIQCSLKT